MKGCMKSVIIFAGLALSGLAAGWLGFRYSQPEPVTRAIPLMSISCKITAPGTPEAVDKPIEQAFQRMREIERKFSAFNQSGPVYRFNHENIPITDPEIIGLIKIAREVHRESAGAFDITIKPLVQLWGLYKNTQPGIPDPNAIRTTLDVIGFQHLIIGNDSVTKDRLEVKIDFGGIAKGYAVKECVKVLRNEGVQSALIELGGQVYGFGKLNKQPWRVGLRHPRDSGVSDVLFINDTSVSTSGDYERFFMKDGVRYHHILNPRTGYPTRGIISMSVIMPDPVLADAWSTAFFVIGPDKALDIIRQKPGMEIIMVTDEGRVIQTPDIARYIRSEK